MTGAEFRAIRKRLGLGVVAWGRALGYQGADNTLSTMIRRYETGGRDLPPWIARLAAMYDRHGIPAEF